MRAAVFPRPQECETVEREVPVPAEHQALVRVHVCGVCGTDAHIYRGEFPARFPVIAGHEFAGVVEKVGTGVSSLRPGDRVAVDPNIHCGSCRPCRRGLTHLCRNLSAIGVTQDGGFATHCVVPARQCHRVPDDMPYEVAAMAEPVACCVHGIDRAGIRSGDVVLLLGAGTIGLVLLQLVRLQGAAVTIVSEPNAGKRDLAERLGATTAVDPVSEDFEQAVKAATGGTRPDVVIECVGSAATAQQAFDLVGADHHLSLPGVPGGDRHHGELHQSLRPEPRPRPAGLRSSPSQRLDQPSAAARRRIARDRVARVGHGDEGRHRDSGTRMT